MSETRRERLERRSLDIGYRHHGKGLSYYSKDGRVFKGWVGLIRVVEETEVVEDNELTIRGYHLRLRNYLFPEDFTPQSGDKLALDRPFNRDHQYFHIDSDPRAFNMSGLQVIMGLTPTTDPALGSEIIPSGTLPTVGYL